MDKHAFRVLEYSAVIEKIAGKTTNIYGREIIEARYPLKEMEEIREIQTKTKEALAILDSTDSFTVGQLRDVRDNLEMARKQIPLQPEEIIAIYDVAVISRQLKNYLSSREAFLPNLYEKSHVLTEFRDLERTIKTSISPDGRILDNASRELASIRRAVQILNDRIHSQLDHFLKNPDYVAMLQDPIITRREHRYVLPVKQEHRSKFPGIVLDSSASGATLFMEPLPVLKSTNELKYQQSEEKREEEQIRLKITRKIKTVADDLARNLEFLGEYDALQAAARFMIDFDCTLPEIMKKPLLDLIKARHPLLEVKPVPINIRIGTDFRGLIITGPNTGGKTVSLKTTGLLTLLAMAGFPIPASDGSKVGMFTGVYADIGDEQSISQNLSTFSAHMSNITRIIPRSGRRTLVLLDEIGAGTDPSEGVALGAALLKYMIKRGSRVIATTHYNELKVFASKSSQFSNAAMEFDEETLEPTFRIIIGLPGRSCALKISESLGVPDEIIDDAKQNMGRSFFKMESLLSEIDREKAKVKKERETAEETRTHLEALKDEYEGKLAKVENEKEKLLEEALEEISDITDNISFELKEARKEWRKSLKDYREGKQTRIELKDEAGKVKSKLDDTIDKLRKLRGKGKKKEEKYPETSETFLEGDPVKITTIGRRGKIVTLLDESLALIQVGSIKMEVPLKDLEKVDIDLSDTPVEYRNIVFEKTLNISDRLDIRGTRAEEGIERVSKFIDDACLAGLDSFQVIHGKGTGLLREAIREYLHRAPRVKSYRNGELHEGGWGVTVVNL